MDETEPLDAVHQESTNLPRRVKKAISCICPARTVPSRVVERGFGNSKQVGDVVCSKKSLHDCFFLHFAI